MASSKIGQLSFWVPYIETPAADKYRRNKKISVNLRYSKCYNTLGMESDYLHESSRCGVCLGRYLYMGRSSKYKYNESTCESCGREFIRNHEQVMVPVGTLWCTEGEQV